MSNYYANHDNALNEVRNVISQRNPDDLNKLINNDEDMTRLIANLSEVKTTGCQGNVFLRSLFRFNKWKQ